MHSHHWISRLMILALVASLGCVEDTEPGTEPTADTDPGTDSGPMPDAGPEDDTGPLPDVGPVPDMAPACADGETRACDIEGGCVGTETCADGAFGPCVGPDEVCGEADDDCDGQVDEGLQCGCPAILPPTIALPADPQDFVVDQDISEIGWEDGGGDAFDDYGQITLRGGDEEVVIDMSLGQQEGSLGGIEFTVDSVLEGNLWTVVIAPVDPANAGPLDVLMTGNLGSDEDTVPTILSGQGLSVLHTTDSVDEPNDPPVFTALVTGDPQYRAQLGHYTAEGSDSVAIIGPAVELPVVLAIAVTFADRQTVADAFGAGLLGECVTPVAEVCGNGVDDNGDEAADCDDALCSVGPHCDERIGNLRIAGGESDRSGRLEIFFAGSWGTVCDDNWSDEVGQQNGDVACRELGFEGLAELDIDAPDGTGVIALDDVECTGDEARLIDCAHTPLGTSDCDHGEDLRLRCYGPDDCRDDAGCDGGQICVDYACIEPPVEICDDGVDNDDDEAIDCRDEDCADDDACNGPPMTAFVTSDLHQGNLGGLAGADAICNARAQAAGLAGNYMAWLANDEGNPAGRFGQNNGPYVRVDGARLATNWADLTNGSIEVPLEIDENGLPVVLDFLAGGAWSAAPADGSGPVGGTCDNWRGSGQGSKGNTSVVDENWARSGNPSNFNCDVQPGRLYCFQQP